MAAAPASTRRRRALLVASGTYADAGLARLRAPAGDVDALAGVLGDESIGGFEVRELVDRPTDEVKRAIEGFFGDARPDDLLLLYFSGHGVLSQSRRFYFATASTTLEYLRTTAIEDGFVNGVMHDSRARTIVLILDCCHSGAFGKGLTPKSGLTVDVEHRFEGRGRVTLSASTALEYAFEEEDPATGINELAPSAPGSLFTSCLVDGLRSGEADVDEDGVISVDELYDYVCDRVRERSPHQTPGMAGDRRGDIVIARSAHRPAPGAPPPPKPPPPVPPRPVQPPPPPPPWWSRRVVVVSAVAAAVAAAAVVAALLLARGPDPPPAAPYDFDRDGRQEIVLGASRGIERESDRAVGRRPPPWRARGAEHEGDQRGGGRRTGAARGEQPVRGGAGERGLRRRRRGRPRDRRAGARSRNRALRAAGRLRASPAADPGRRATQPARDGGFRFRAAGRGLRP